MHPHRIGGHVWVVPTDRSSFCNVGMPFAIQHVQTACRVQICKPHATCMQPAIADCINNRDHINLAEVSRADKSAERSESYTIILLADVWIARFCLDRIATENWESCACERVNNVNAAQRAIKKKERGKIIMYRTWCVYCQWIRTSVVSLSFACPLACIYFVTFAYKSNL